MKSIFMAVGLLLIFEGLMPFANPAGWRKFLHSMQAFKDGQLRFVGFVMLILGAILLFIVPNFL